VRLKLEHLLANPEVIQQYCGDDQPRGLKVLYEDKDLGFQVLAHINDKARVSPPHDHGASWAIYGQATKYTDMIEWDREDNGGEMGTLAIGWLRWHLLGDEGTTGKEMFIGSNCGLCNSEWEIMWKMEP